MQVMNNRPHNTVACTASSAVVMAGVPQQNRTKNKVMWPARLATAEEARAYRIEHGLPLVRSLRFVERSLDDDDEPDQNVA